MGEVVEFNGITRLDIPVSRIFKSAQKEALEGAIVIGWTEDGEFYFASSYASGPEILWLFEIAKKKLLEVEIDNGV